MNLCFSRNSSEIPRRVEIPFQPYDEEVYDALPDEYCVGDDESEREASEIKKKYVNIPPPKYRGGYQVNTEYNLGKDFSKLKVNNEG